MFDGERYRFEAVIVPDPPARSGEAGSERIEALVSLQRLRSFLDYQEQFVLAEIAADPGDCPGWLAKNLAREEVACALRIPEPLAEAKLHTATELVDRFPATLNLLGDGKISMLQARILVEAAADLDDVTATALEAAVLGRAGSQTGSAFRRSSRTRPPAGRMCRSAWRCPL